MKYYTGDEAGLIKTISFPPLKRVKKPKISVELKDNAPQPLIQTWDKIQKEREIQQMIWGVWDGQRHIVTARRDGRVEYRSTKSGDIVKEYKLEGIKKDNNEMRCVGLFANESSLYTLTSSGAFTIHEVSSVSTPSNSISYSLPSNICCMRTNPHLTNLIAIGGKEVELTIYDLNVLDKSSPSIAAEQAKNNKKDSSKANGVQWKAKNIANDFLDLRVPVHVKDIQFLSVDGSKLVIGTHFHQIRLYDTKAGRRPKMDVSIGENPVVALSIGRTLEEVIFSDTMSNVYALDLRMGKVSAQFKGFAGSVSALAVAPATALTTSSNSSTVGPHLVTVSLDRHLRIHEMNSSQRSILHKIYLKQRLTCLLVDEEDDSSKAKDTDGEEDEDEGGSDNEMWSEMKVAGGNDTSKNHQGKVKKRRR